MSIHLKKNNQISRSEQQTLDRIDLVSRSIQIWNSYKEGKLSKIQYQLLQDATIKEIRENEKNG